MLDRCEFAAGGSYRIEAIGPQLLRLSDEPARQLILEPLPSRRTRVCGAERRRGRRSQLVFDYIDTDVITGKTR